MLDESIKQQISHKIKSQNTFISAFIVLRESELDLDKIEIIKNKEKLIKNIDNCERIGCESGILLYKSILEIWCWQHEKILDFLNTKETSTSVDLLDYHQKIIVAIFEEFQNYTKINSRYERRDKLLEIWKYFLIEFAALIDICPKEFLNNKQKNESLILNAKHETVLTLLPLILVIFTAFLVFGVLTYYGIWR
jgi:hypothetical protein